MFKLRKFNNQDNRYIAHTVTAALEAYQKRNKPDTKYDEGRDERNNDPGIMISEKRDKIERL